MAWFLAQVTALWALCFSAMMRRGDAAPHKSLDGMKSIYISHFLNASRIIQARAKLATKNTAVMPADCMAGKPRQKCVIAIDTSIPIAALVADSIAGVIPVLPVQYVPFCAPWR